MQIRPDSAGVVQSGGQCHQIQLSRICHLSGCLQHHQKVLVSVKDTGEEFPLKALTKSGNAFTRGILPEEKTKKEPALAFPSPKKSSRPTRNTSMWSALPEQEPNLPFPCQSQDIPWKYPISFFDRNVQKMLTASQIFPKS